MTTNSVSKSLEDRFNAGYLAEPMSGCWLWEKTVAREKKPYGRISHLGRMYAAHRVAYELYVGPIYDGLWVLHKCDNPACVNPDHLRLGTGMDNVQDRDAKGRTAAGSRCTQAKLSIEQIAAILKDHRLAKDVGRDYGISRWSIYKLRNGTTYRGERNIVLAGDQKNA